MRLLLQLQPIHICCFSWDLPGFVWNLKLGRFELAGQKAGGTSCCPNLLLFLVVRNNILYSFVSFFLLNFMKCSTIVMFLVTICKNPIDVSFNSPLVKVCDVRHVVPSFFWAAKRARWKVLVRCHCVPSAIGSSRSDEIRIERRAPRHAVAAERPPGLRSRSRGPESRWWSLWSLGFLPLVCVKGKWS